MTGKLNIGDGLAYWELSTFGERGAFSGFISFEGEYKLSTTHTMSCEGIYLLYQASR